MIIKSSQCLCWFLFLLANSLWMYCEHFVIFCNPKHRSLYFPSISGPPGVFAGNIYQNDANPLSYTRVHLQQSKQIGLFISRLHFHKSCNCFVDYRVGSARFRRAPYEISCAPTWIVTWPNSLNGLLKSVKGQVITLILWTGFRQTASLVWKRLEPSRMRLIKVLLSGWTLLRLFQINGSVLQQRAIHLTWKKRKKKRKDYSVTFNSLWFCHSSLSNGIDGDLHDLAGFELNNDCNPKFAKASLTRCALIWRSALAFLEYSSFLFQLNQFVTAEMLR